MAIRDENTPLIEILKEEGVLLKYPQDCGNSEDVTYLLPYSFRLYKGTVQLLHNQDDPKYKEECDTINAEAMERFEKWWSDGGCISNLAARKRALAKAKK